MSKPISLISKINHIAIACKNISESARIYQNLGLIVSDKMSQREHGVFTSFIDFGNSCNTKIELLEPFGSGSPISNFLKKNDFGGIHHICLQTSDLNQIVNNLQKINVFPLGQRKIGAHGNSVIFLNPKQCNGVLIEIEEEK